MARKHKCNWHGCELRVDGWRWGCSSHYMRLPQHIRDRMRTVKSHWPEYRPLKREAIAFSKTEEGIQPRGKPTVCKCGGTVIKRLPIPECLDCHKKRVFGDIGSLTGEKE